MHHVATWIEALGTWAVFIAAIWGDRLKAWLFKPRLQLELLSTVGEFTMQTTHWVDDNNTPRKGDVAARYYHLVVTNGQRLSPAHNVQVVITNLETPGPDQLPQSDYRGALPLPWRPAELGAFSHTIGRRQDADLLFVNEKGILKFTTMWLPNNFKAVYQGATRLWVTVRAQCDELDAASLRIEIAWDGKWDPGEAEMARHLTISTKPAA